LLQAQKSMASIPGGQLLLHNVLSPSLAHSRLACFHLRIRWGSCSHRQVSYRTAFGAQKTFWETQLFTGAQPRQETEPQVKPPAAKAWIRVYC
jgi:hypothetical protein